MARTVADLLAALSQVAPLGKAAAWDPVGLQLGEPDAPVERVGVCHEVTKAVVTAVEREPLDLLISYHPLLFRPTARLVAGPGAEGRALRLLRAGASLAVVHTAFDAAPGGASDALAEALEVRGARPFGPVEGPPSVKIATFVPAERADALLDAVVAAGAATIGGYTHCSWRAEGMGTFFAGAGTDPVVGRRGELNREPEVRLEFAAPREREAAVLQALVAAHPYEEPAFDVYDRRGEAGQVGRIGDAASGCTLAGLARLAGQRLGAANVRVAGDPSRALGRIAVVPGSGADLVDLAADLGADALVTGDVSHHRARGALDRGMAVVDAGHAPSERPGLRRLLERVAELAPSCVSLLEHDADPWGPG